MIFGTNWFAIKQALPPIVLLPIVTDLGKYGSTLIGSGLSLFYLRHVTNFTSVVQRKSLEDLVILNNSVHGECLTVRNPKRLTVRYHIRDYILMSRVVELGDITREEFETGTSFTHIKLLPVTVSGKSR